MKISKPISAILILSCVLLVSCSDSKKDSKSDKDSASVSVVVKSSTTTEGTTTTKDMDENIEDTSVDTLKVLFAGEAEKDDFANEAAYTESLTDFSGQNGKVITNLHYLKADGDNSLVSADVEFNGKAYQVYIDPDGKVIGFRTPPTTTTTTTEKATG